jgi:hypothetical protein
MDLPQQSGNPANKPADKTTSSNAFEIFEASLTFQEQPAHSGGSAMDKWERSTVWTA